MIPPVGKKYKTTEVALGGICIRLIGANLHGELTESQSRRIMYALHPLQGAKPWQDDLARNEKATKDYKDWRLANPRSRRNNNDKDW